MRREINDSKCNIETSRIDNEDTKLSLISINTQSCTRQIQFNVSIPRIPHPAALCYLARGSKNDDGQSKGIFKSLTLTKPPLKYLGDNKNLMTVDLMKSSLTKFPIEVFNTPLLCVLRLDNNKLTSLPSEISYLSQLKVLTVAKNKLNSIPKEVTKLSYLEVLVLNGNEIIEWPPWLSSLKRLRFLYLHENPNIGTIPVEVANMDELTDLGFDWFIYLPPSAGRVMKNKANSLQIKKLKDLCKELKASKVKTCKFFKFLSYFTNRKELNPRIYPKERTAFHLAVSNNHYHIINEYLSQKINPNIQDSDGATAFECALEKNNHKTIYNLLLDKRIDVTLVSKKYGNSLHIAILNQQFEIAKRIIMDPRFDPNLVDVDGNAPLHYAFAKFDCKPVLTKNLCTQLVSLSSCKLNIVNNADEIPLITAIRNAQDNAIQFALEFNDTHRGAREFDFVFQKTKNGVTPLHYIAKYSDVQIVKLVLEKLNCNPFIKTHAGRTIKSYASNLSSTKVIRRYEKWYVRNFFHRNKERLNDYNKTLLLDTKRGMTSDRRRISPCISPCDSINETEIPINLIKYSSNRESIYEKTEDYYVSTLEESHNIPQVIRENIHLKASNDYSLKHNQFTNLYKVLLENKIPKYQQYRIIYFLLRKYHNTSDAALIMLSKYLSNNSLKSVVEDLLEITSIDLPDAYNTKRVSGMERKVIGRGRSCEPKKKHQSKVKRALSKTQNVKEINKYSNTDTYRFPKKINSIYVSKRDNYFNAVNV